jgi:hypothetical protein
MAFNLNRSQKPDYSLSKNLIDEMITIYGVECDYLFTEKMNVDNILMDFSHLKLDEGNSKKIYILPENQDTWENDLQFNIFGLDNKRYVNFYMSRDTLLTLVEDGDFNKLVNSLIVTPNGTILEISNVVDRFEGINNLFLYDDDVSVIRITTIPYYNRQHNELDYSTTPDEFNEIPTDAPEGIEADYREEPPTDNYEDEFKNLDDFFNALDDKKKAQNIEGAKVSNDDSVFGSLG